MKNHRFQIGLLTVVALVALRLGLGCHFFYEGVWKIVHADEFTAEPFLMQAKGPMANLFYAMVPDLYGRQRLKTETVKDEKTGKEEPRVDLGPVKARWEEIRLNLLSELDPGATADKEAKEAHIQLVETSEKILEKHKAQLADYFKGEAEAIEGFFGSLDRFEDDPERHQGAPFQKRRRWNRMMYLRAEARAWLQELEDREQVYLGALRSAMTEQQREQADPALGTWKIWQWSRIEQINFAVTYALTAIGLCLLLGLFTRLAALGGAGFMAFVVMTQLAWPTIYPPDPTSHALLINKDFIEMLALLVIATTTAGRWGGLDYWVHHLIIEPFRAKRLSK